MIKFNLQLFASRTGIDPVTGKRTSTSDPNKKLNEDTFGSAVKRRTQAGEDLNRAIESERSARALKIDQTTGDIIGSTRESKGGGGGGSVRNPQIDIQRQQQQLIEAARRGKVSSLESAQQRALGATGLQKKEEGQARIGQRTGVKTASQQASRRLSEMLAAQGLSRSGARTGQELATSVTRQQGISDSLAGEATALGQIGQRESDIRQQFAQGVAQADIGAEVATQQAALAQLQQEANRAQQMEDLQASQDFASQAQAQADAIATQKAEVDRALFEADRTFDFERKAELENLKSQLNQDEIKLRAQLTPARSSGSGGLSFSQDRQVFQDQVKQGIQGVDSIVGRLGDDPTGETQTNAMLSYLAQLEAQGVDQSVIDAIAASRGINLNAQPTTGGLPTGSGLSEGSLIGLSGLRQ